MVTTVVFLLDVDNTLLDNDAIIEELMRHLEREVGRERQQCYWAIFEQLRAELGYADYLGALQRYRIEYPRDPHLLMVSHFLVNYPFASRLYPNARDVVDRFKQWGIVVILSDGDVVFQPHKVERSGLSDAVQGNVLIYIHKERELDDVEQRYPAEHYLLVDDKLRILKGFGPPHYPGTREQDRARARPRYLNQQPDSSLPKTEGGVIKPWSISPTGKSSRRRIDLALPYLLDVGAPALLRAFRKSLKWTR